MEKKAHSSVKYGDFLISDVTELFNSSHNSIDNQVSQKLPSNRNHTINTTKSYKKSFSKHKSQNHEENHNYTIIYSNDEQTKPSDMMTSSKNSIVSVEFEDLFPNTSLNIARQEETPSFNPTGYQTNPIPPVNPDKVVKILSEKTISEPVVIEGKLEPISPSMILRRPARKVKSGLVYDQRNWDMTLQLKTEESVMPQEQTIVFEQTVPIEYAPKELENIQENNQNVQENITETQNQIMNLNSAENEKNVNSEDHKQIEIPIEQEFLNRMLKTAENLTEPEYASQSNVKSIITPTSTPVFKSVLKNKITPEKLAAIEQKRRFNLKLRDVISSCLDMDDQKQVIGKNISQEKKQTAKRILRSAPTSPSSRPQGTLVSYLESRLQRMEDTLLNKIDHNTQRINELKRTIKPSSNSRNANTQTYLNHMSELSQKQYLYKEISKFLSQSANIKVFEELFLDKTSPNDVETVSPRKLRKRR